jgi:peptidyl-prolyl cis-trans isomerase D
MIRFLQTPGPIKKFVLGGLLIVISILMVITLVPGFGNSDFFGRSSSLARGILASVNGNDVTTVQVEKAARQMLRQQNMGPQASALLPFFISQAAQQLISERVIVAEAHRLGFRATDEDVRNELQHGQYSQVFFPGGNFIGVAAYEERLQQADLTVPEFEQEVKDQILFTKLRNLVTSSAGVSEAEIRDKFEKDNTKVKFDYAVFRKDDLLKTIHPNEAELILFFSHNKANYANSIPEKRKVAYVLVDTAKLEAQEQVSQKDLQTYYDQHLDEYRVPEQVNVRHIFIKTPLPGPGGRVDPKGLAAAKEKADDVLQQLKAGANFSELAKKYSDDAGSAKNGGSLGWIQRGRFPSPDVEKAAFSLAKGQTSDVVSTTGGFDIIHVDDKQEAHLKSLDEVKSQIEPILKQQNATRAAEGIANSLATEARNSGLEKAAAAKGLQVVTTDFVSRTDSLPGIGESPEFMDALFNAVEKSPPDEVALSKGYAIFQLLAVKPPATPSLEEIRGRVETDFKNERVATLMTQKTQELSDRAKAEHDLKKAAKELGATMKTSDFVLPDGQVPDIGSMSGPASVAFTLKPGEISGPINTGESGVVLSVLEKQEPTSEDFAAKKEQIRDELLQTKKSELFALFLDNVRDQMEKSGKIKVNQEEMKLLTKQNEGEEGE